MTSKIMPRATAVWLIDNTGLTFRQIADFTGMHILEIRVIADGANTDRLEPFNPVTGNVLTAAEIERCESDPGADLRTTGSPEKVAGGKRKYVPLSKRKDKPGAIAFLLTNYEELSEADIVRLLSTSTKTIAGVREAMSNDNIHSTGVLEPRSPVASGLCSEEDLDKLLSARRPVVS